jgi:hypothetical protein
MGSESARVICCLFSTAETRSPPVSRAARCLRVEKAAQGPSPARLQSYGQAVTIDGWALRQTPPSLPTRKWHSTDPLPLSSTMPRASKR